MKFVIQRVKEASVKVDDEYTGKIKKGYLVLIGVGQEDTKEEADKYIRKMINLRIFEDENGKTNGAPVEDSAIQGVKVGMMGPLAGVGDPVFWFTARPILGALGASLAMGGSILGPILFFVLWNVIRWAFMWYTQEFGYNVGTKITEDLSGGLLQKVTKGASILGMFVLGALIERWVSINFTPVVSKVTLSKGAYIDWAKLPAGAEGIKTALTQQASGMALDPTKVTTLQDNLNSLIPGFVPLLLTLLCMWLLKKNVSPIIIIIALFIIGIGGHVIGLL